MTSLPAYQAPENEPLLADLSAGPTRKKRKFRWKMWLLILLPLVLLGTCGTLLLTRGSVISTSWSGASSPLVGHDRDGTAITVQQARTGRVTRTFSPPADHDGVRVQADTLRGTVTVTVEAGDQSQTFTATADQPVDEIVWLEDMGRLRLVFEFADVERASASARTGQRLTVNIR